MMKIVSRDDCPFCEKAIELMRNNYENFEVMYLTDQSQIDLFKFMGHLTVPYIVGIGGYNDLVKHYEKEGA